MANDFPFVSIPEELDAIEGRERRALIFIAGMAHKKRVQPG
jgi:hypothetical protein